MKNIIKIVILIFSIFSFEVKGQDKKLQGVWISTANDVIVIKEKGNNFNILSTANREEQLKVNVKKDTISFYTQYTKLGSEKSYLEKYDFYISKLTDRRLALIPTSILSREFFGNKKIIFTKQEYNVDKTILFDKLVYHTTNCLGTCPKIDLEIDKDGKVYLNRDIIDNKEKSGVFEGQLSSDAFDKLIDILKTSNVKSWSFPEKDGYDGAVTTLIMYYNGERKYFKSMFPPTISHQLINFLYNLEDSKMNLVRINKSRSFEY
ncbi:DUF6438 domain-containing protein [Chryseobacterium sp.]|jgi:ribosomal protein L31|uniref:DUF6438 domain-containing protein n=1 Tax=Chryseobacterium sp. TaxID=1871047 RepID=UPI0028462D79|nr:DUF6438 domain-containing protein [Chryseobacterium sp.]MDR3025445.1 DUF6438 domain-containing protein [Chryseobacterium sp.]